MNKFPLFLALLVILGVSFSSCLKDDTKDNWDTYKEWRETNTNWLKEQAGKKNSDGSNYYKQVTAAWDSKASVYVHYFNDTTATRKNLSPLYTSTVAVKYKGRLYNDVAFDSSYLRTDSIFKTQLSGVIQGWAVALSDMHIGDSCEVLIPYDLAYGATGTSGIKPYSTLVFDIKLVAIPGYEIKP